MLNFRWRKSCRNLKTCI